MNAIDRRAEEAQRAGVRGGQGRSDEDVYGDGEVALVIAGFVLAILFIGLMVRWWVG